MQTTVLRKLFLGFIQIHILHHAKEQAIYGTWMIEELNHHGYEISPGTLYPLLHRMEKTGLLSREEKIVEGKVWKYYRITEDGNEVLEEARKMAQELAREIKH